MKCAGWIVVAIAVGFLLPCLSGCRPVLSSTQVVKPSAEPKPLLRKFGDLTPADFETHPVWVNCHVVDCDEPWYEEADEETFRPWLKATPVDPSETLFLVRASFRLADGTTYPGFITPQNPQAEDGKPSLGLIQPQLFLPSGRRVAFWFGIMDPPKEMLADLYASLGKTGAAVFPLTFAAQAGLATGIVTGSVPGFCSRSREGEVKVTR